MEALSDCCGAVKHWIHEDLCSKCLEHCYFEYEEDI